MLKKAGWGKDEDLDLYIEALTYSKRGYSIIQQRDVDEIFVNSYNPEWTRAWKGNTDLQVCLDFFAVITYITEYFTKDDTGMMVKLTEMVKNSECATLKEKMVLLMNTYMTARQMGESEAYYKIFPDLHLKDSNVTTVFVPTSRKENRSKFLKQVEEKDNCFGKVKKKIEGKGEKLYVEMYDLVDKYIRRDKKCKSIDELTYSQYYKMYSTCRKDNRKIKKSEKNIKEDKVLRDLDDEDNYEDVEEEFDETENDVKAKKKKENKFHFVMMADERRLGKVPLPEFIELDNPHPGEPNFMRKRNYPAVLRFHKVKASLQPEEYYYSEALLYTPFRSEAELEKRVAEASADNYITLNSKIQAVKFQVMEHLESTEEACFMVE